MWGRNVSLTVGHGAAGWAHSGVVTHVGTRTPAGPQQVEWSEQVPSSWESWRGRDHHECVRESVCICMQVFVLKTEIFGQKSLCSWKTHPAEEFQVTYCWTLRCWSCCCPTWTLSLQIMPHYRLRNCVKHRLLHPAPQHQAFNYIHSALMDDEQRILLIRCNLGV